MIKLVASDIDGTLVKDSTPHLYPEIIEAVMELEKLGIIFFAASGRTYESIRSMFSEVADKIGYVAENGAHIVYQGNNLHICSMKQNLVQQIFREIETFQKPYECVVSTPMGSYLRSDSDPKFVKLMEIGYQNKLFFVDHYDDIQEPIMKIALYHPGSIREIGEQHFIPKWENQVKICIAGEEWLDFMDASVDKGNALQYLQHYFKITEEETMAFGDNTNDIGLMRAAGHSYAVENARDEVKQAAKFSCLSYDKKGVYEILKGLYTKGGEMDA